MEDCAHIYLGRRREKERKGKDKRKRTRRKGKAPACAGCNATAAMLAGCNAVVESPKSAMHSQERRETERRSGRKSSEGTEVEGCRRADKKARPRENPE